MKLKRVIAWTAGVVMLALLGLLLIAYLRSNNSCYDGSAAVPNKPMKAVVYCDYGAADVLKIQAVEKPVADSNQVLVRVHAVSVNPLDWHFMRGEPYIGRIGMGLRRPSVIRLGVDFAGVVESVGPRVTQFKPGDEVFGGRTGALAQYVLVGEDRAIVRKPSNLTFEQAAAVPVAAVTALQGLRDKGMVKPGQRVLINGASGGVGTFAVQLAKSFGAHVTGVSSTRNVDLVRSLGADQVIDYTKEDFTEGTQRYDLIIDNVGNHSLKDLRELLNPNGIYVMIGGPAGRWIAPFPRVIKAMMMSKFGDHEMKFFLADLNKKDLTILAELMESGKVTPVIDRQYDLNQVRDAIAYLEAGRARGKVIVTVN